MSSDSLTVYVGGVSYQATEEDLSSFFAQCGEVVSVRMPTFPDSGRCKGIAFVEFADKSGADAALELTDSEFLGRSIRVDLARGSSGGNRDRNRDGGDRRTSGGYGQRDRSSERYGGSSSRRGGASGSRYGNNNSSSRPASDPSDSVFVGNLSWDATEKDLQETFGNCGSIVSVRIPTDRVSGRQKGFGYITFDSVDAAEKAIGLSGTDVAGRSVRVDYAASRRD